MPFGFQEDPIRQQKVRGVVTHQCVRNPFGFIFVFDPQVGKKIMTLDKHSSPNDIIEGFDEALEEYETLLQHINKNVQRH